MLPVLNTSRSSSLASLCALLPSRNRSGSVCALMQTGIPTGSPTSWMPSPAPTHVPSYFPSVSPTMNPTATPTGTPSFLPSDNPTVGPTRQVWLCKRISAALCRAVAACAGGAARFQRMVIPAFFAPSAIRSLAQGTPVPTELPTLAGTTTPTLSPTLGPTAPPTAIPSRVPTPNVCMASLASREAQCTHKQVRLRTVVSVGASCSRLSSPHHCRQGAAGCRAAELYRLGITC